MKKGYWAVTAIFLCAALLGGCSSIGALTTDSTNAVLSPAPNDAVPSIPTELLALRFDGYENMTIAEYRGKAIAIIAENEATYLDLIDQVSTDSKIQGERYSNADAYFAVNILIPTVAEKWNTWRFSNSSVSDHYMTEYTVRRRFSYRIPMVPPHPFGTQFVYLIVADLAQVVGGLV